MGFGTRFCATYTFPFLSSRRKRISPTCELASTPWPANPCAGLKRNFRKPRSGQGGKNSFIKIAVSVSSLFQSMSVTAIQRVLEKFGGLARFSSFSHSIPSKVGCVLDGIALRVVVKVDKRVLAIAKLLPDPSGFGSQLLG